MTVVVVINDIHRYELLKCKTLIWSRHGQSELNPAHSDVNLMIKKYLNKIKKFKSYKVNEKSY